MHGRINLKLPSRINTLGLRTIAGNAGGCGLRGAMGSGHLPVDYFSGPRRHALREQLGLGAWMLVLLKNVAGGLLVMIGFILLFMPGQGVLMMLVGLLIMNFPGKYRLERLLVAREGVFRALNWLRVKHSLPPFENPRQ